MFELIKNDSIIRFDVHFGSTKKLQKKKISKTQNENSVYCFVWFENSLNFGLTMRGHILWPQIYLHTVNILIYNNNWSNVHKNRINELFIHLNCTQKKIVLSIFTKFVFLFMAKKKNKIRQNKRIKSDKIFSHFNSRWDFVFILFFIVLLLFVFIWFAIKNL